MRLLKYICFKSSADFEAWQEDNPGCEVFNITPLVSGVDFKFDALNPDEARGTTDVTVFVIYRQRDEA